MLVILCWCSYWRLQLVYVSTVNVAFDHTPKLGLDEASAPYVDPSSGFTDVYSITKMWAGVWHSVLARCHIDAIHLACCCT